MVIGIQMNNEKLLSHKKLYNVSVNTIKILLTVDKFLSKLTNHPLHVKMGVQITRARKLTRVNVSFFSGIVDESVVKKFQLMSPVINPRTTFVSIPL